MSGIEVVGVVLGTIPLIIAGLEHYARGLEMIRYTRSYATVVETHLTTLAAITCIYRSSCESLLSPLMLAEERLLELLESTDSNAWREDDLQEALATRLGASQASYMAVIKELDRKIIRLKNYLHLDDNMKPKWVVETTTSKPRPAERYLRNPLRALKWGLKCEKLKGLVDEIDADVRRIETLTRLNVKLESTRLQKKFKAKADELLKKRKRATDIFKSLDSMLPCPKRCCQTPIQFNMQLEVVKSAQTDVFQAGLRFLSLRHHGPLNGQRQVPNWRLLEVESEERVATVPQSSLRRPRSRGKVVSFASTTSSHASKTRQRQALVCGSEIRDLCSCLAQSPKDRCLGYLANEPWHHHVHHVDNESKKPTSQEPIHLISLKDILKVKGASIFTPVHKYKLAASLSLAVVHLYSTPWLSQSWTTADVYFPDQESNHSQLDQAYLSRVFTATRASRSKQPSKSRGWVQDEVVYALGIVLIELSFEKPILEMKTEDDLHNGEETSTTEWQIATRILKTFEQREPSRYVEAARACIHCRLGTSGTGLADSTCIEHFYQGIVLPLLQLYEFVTGTDQSQT